MLVIRANLALKRKLYAVQPKQQNSRRNYLRRKVRTRLLERVYLWSLRKPIDDINKSVM